MLGGRIRALALWSSFVAAAPALGCGPSVMPAIVQAAALEDDAGKTCASDDLFADVPVESLVVDGELWVRGAGGTLASLGLGDDKTINYHLEHERVIDVHHSSGGGSGGALWALTIADEPGDLRIWQRTVSSRGEPRGWFPMWEMGATSDAMALVELGGWPAVITPERIYVATGELWTRELDPPLPAVTHYQAVAHGSHVWVSARGVGWLYRVDAKTGRVSGVADVSTRPCAGLLDPTCDVISDIDVDLKAPGCALVTTRGRVLRACPDDGISVAHGVRRAVRADWAEQMRALAHLYPEGSLSRLHLLSLIRAENPMDLVRVNLRPDVPTLDADPIEALAPTTTGYLALGEDALYHVSGKRNRRVALEGLSRRTQCGLDVTQTDAAVIVGGTLPLVAAKNAAAPLPSETLTAPPAPCEDTVIFFATAPGADGAPKNVVLRCEDGAATMVLRERPRDRFFAVPAVSWRALWQDLERAQWRDWKSCDPVEGGEPNDRFMISTGKSTLQVDCPNAALDSRQRAVVERLRSLVMAMLASETSVSEPVSEPSAPASGGVTSGSRPD